MHGMQKVSGSNPLSSTDFSDICPIFSDNERYAVSASSLSSSSKMLSMIVAPPRTAGTITRR
jgi:hypothetical protein